MLVMQVKHFWKLDNMFGFTHQKRSRVSVSKKLLCNWFGPYPIPYRLRSERNKKVTFTVHTNRMKPYLDPALRSIEDAWSKPYLDESDIPDDSLEVCESFIHDNVTNVTAENDTHSLLHSEEDPDNLNQQVSEMMMILYFFK